MVKYAICQKHWHGEEPKWPPLNTSIPEHDGVTLLGEITQQQAFLLLAPGYQPPSVNGHTVSGPFEPRTWCLARAEAREALAMEAEREDRGGAAADYRQEAEYFRAVAERLPRNATEEALLECHRILDEVSPPTLGMWTQWFMRAENIQEED